MAIKIFPKGSGERLSANFKAYEFDCRCDRCTETKIDTDLVVGLQKLRDKLTELRGKDTPIHINSGHRCEAHNTAVGGAKASRHMQGSAADITVPGVSPDFVAAAAENVGFLGIGLYDGFVHVDTRPNKAFWYSHKQLPRTTFGGSQEPQEGEETATATVTVELPVLRRGCQGETVAAAQAILQHHGFTVGAYGADGKFGEVTESAVLCFQEDVGLTEDGIVGALTWAKLLGL